MTAKRRTIDTDTGVNTGHISLCPLAHTGRIAAKQATIHLSPASSTISGAVSNQCPDDPGAVVEIQPGE